MNRAPGMVDVAREAGVSHVTVSRVLNDHPSVRPETRARVEAAIEKLGYRRNSVARALKSRRSSTIGVVLAGDELYELARILRGVQTAAQRAGYWANLASWQGGTTRDLAETLQRLTDQAVEGIAVIGDRPMVVDALAGIVTGVPMTVVMSGNVPNPDLGFVELDQEYGARLAVDHLLELGHRHIVHLTGALRTFDARARVKGWQAAMAGVPDAHGEELEGDFTGNSGYRLAHYLTTRRDRELPTAIFAGNDQMAMGVLAAFAELGVKVPGDVSLVGFDDIAGAAYLVPALTTVRQDFVSLGARSVEQLLGMLRGEPASSERIAPELVVRRSTAPPRSRA
ncbi:LacI family DNA-binding transcriptional regulator [Nonomuraea phyllanthi]|uniref:LacI family DNA-binding transcriptional regulator n=1 Tax=Nonomuraea phyllanthi TaxID=2219224 RepID=A0A5C4WHU4_9ACTN|nr:LacI family DNA-binding transcriptional regulator [Nonomuraea phyllanthi]KAB8194084.1 LacI family DNA-binding transcriptional regulator [Nonomuraea phyllanthi]